MQQYHSNGHILRRGSSVDRSTMQRAEVLSVTEAELSAMIMSVQDMMFVYNVIMSLGVKV